MSPAAKRRPERNNLRCSGLRKCAELGITTGTYFSPHLLEQPYFQKACVGGPLPVCDDVSARMISLPLFDVMTHHEVDQVAQKLHALLGVMEPVSHRQKPVGSERYVPLPQGDMSNASGEIAFE